MFRTPLPPIDDETVVLWEPCSRSHGEIVPGFASLLLDLGYKVAVLLTPARLDEGLFSRFTHPRLTLCRLPQWRIRRVMRTPAIEAARAVLISTAGKLPQRRDGRPDLARVFRGVRPRRVLLVDHDAADRLRAGTWDPDLITLRALPGIPSRVVNPHDFGPTAARGAPGRPVRFLMVGAAQPTRRNQGLVYAAFEALKAAGQDGFQLRLVGAPGGPPLPAALTPHVVSLGRVDFRQLYAEAEAADFLLTAFQPDNPAHDAYRTTKTTGAFQLSYGFRLPAIVHRAFTIGSILTEETAVLYDSDDALASTLAGCLEMGPRDHAAKVAALTEAADGLRARSRAALEAALAD